MFDEITNEHIEVLKSQQKHYNKICGISAIILSALFGLSFIPNLFLALPIVRIIICALAIVDLCWAIAANITFGKAISDVQIAAALKALNSNEEDNAFKREKTTSAKIIQQNKTAETTTSISQPPQTTINNINKTSINQNCKPDITSEHENSL